MIIEISYLIVINNLYVYVAFGQIKSDGQSVASRQQALTATYERLVQAAEVYEFTLSVLNLQVSNLGNHSTCHGARCDTYKC